jgi:hypothetical protein
MTITTSTEISRLKGDAAELDRRVFEWFGQARTRGLVVTGPMIQEKAKLVAIHMNISTFKASKGWLNRFQKRHNVYLRSISGESLGVTPTVAQSWKATSHVAAWICTGDVFNCDEKRLFWRALSNKTLAQKGDMCKCGKLAKERLTVLPTVSATGQKEMPLVVGMAKMPRAFGGRLLTGIKWHSSSKAWMTSRIFIDFLETLMHEWQLRTGG